MAEHRVLIGACGWEHAEWRGDFYPDDLPPEWRLGYYSNLYPIVLAGPTEWAHGQPADWAAEIGDGFHMLGELPTTLVARALDGTPGPLLAWLDAWSALGERAVGLLVPPLLAELDAELQTRIAAHGPLAWDSSPEQGTSGLSSAHGPVPIWSGPPTGPELDPGPLAVARLAPAAQELRSLRSVLEALLAASGQGRRAVLLIDGSPPDPQVLEAASTLLDLL